jgi:hypothetical protein
VTAAKHSRPHATSTATSTATSSIPSPSPIPADEWRIIFSNQTIFNATTNAPTCGGADAITVTFGPTSLNQCTLLGSSVNEFQKDGIGETAALNCVFLFDGGSCDGVPVISIRGIDAFLNPDHACRGVDDATGNLASWDAAMYSDQGCPPDMKV